MVLIRKPSEHMRSHDVFLEGGVGGARYTKTKDVTSSVIQYTTQTRENVINLFYTIKTGMVY